MEKIVEHSKIGRICWCGSLQSLRTVHKLRHSFKDLPRPQPPFAILCHLLAYPQPDDIIHKRTNEIVIKVYFGGCDPSLGPNFLPGDIF